MPIKFTKRQLADRDAMIALLREKGDALGDAMEAYNEAIADAWADLAPALVAYNTIVEKIAEGDGNLGEVVAGMRDEFGEKSEAWQGGPKGEAADQFIRAYEEALADLEPVEVEEPQMLYIPDFSAVPGALEEECSDAPDTVDEEAA